MLEEAETSLDDNEVADIDEDEDSTGGGVTKPWDPAKIRITTKTFTLREIATQIEQKELELAPDFQRAYVWKERQRTRLVESILLGIPLPAFYFNQDKDDTYQVVDGVQRLSTINRFITNQHELSAGHLEYLKDVAGKNYGSLEASLRRRFASTQIVVHIIEPQTPDEVKYDIFSRVNTLGSPLSPQEIRHAMSKVRSRAFLLRLAHLESFAEATCKLFFKRHNGQDVRDDHRMMDRELVLRFCAFRLTSLEAYRGFESLDAFLLQFTKRIDGADPALCDTDLDALERAFAQAMTNAHKLLGKLAFRRTRLSGKGRGPVNRALFESQALALADVDWATLEPRRDAVVAALQSLCADADYISAVTVSTGDPEKIRVRLERTRQAVLEALT